MTIQARIYHKNVVNQSLIVLKLKTLPGPVLVNSKIRYWQKVSALSGKVCVAKRIPTSIIIGVLKQ